MKRKIVLLMCLLFCLTGCREVDSKIIVDYRHIPEHTEVHSDTVRTSCPSCGKQVDGEVIAESHYYPEEFQLLYEYLYDDGSKKRVWEDCTRFEYENAVIELGGNL